MTQIAFVAYPGVTALDVVGPYEVLRNLPHAQVRFVWLRGRRATSHWLTLPALKAFGAIPVADERIVHQDNIVTSAGVSAGLDLALWLAGQLGGEARAKAIQLAIEYDPQPPFDSGHMSKASPTTKAAATALLSKDRRQTGQSDGRNAARLGAGAGCCAVATAQAAARWRAGTSPVDSRGVADVPLDAQERLELCDLLEELGPAVATLIEGWTAHDLAAHIVLRERDLVAGLCIVLPGPFQRFAERRRARLAQSKDFTWLVARIRSGPPMGFFRIGWVRTLANLNEFFVHHEDVRRASGRGPRSLTPEMDAALWRNVRRGSHFLSRRLHGCGLEIEWVGTGKRVRVRSGEPTARLTRPPGELLLYVFGRRAVARVEVSGPLEAIAAVHRTHFGM